MIENKTQLSEIVEKSAVVFVSEDGNLFDLYVGGRKVCYSNGIEIIAGAGDSVRVKVNYDGVTVGKCE